MRCRHAAAMRSRQGSLGLNLDLADGQVLKVTPGGAAPRALRGALPLPASVFSSGRSGRAAGPPCAGRAAERRERSSLLSKSALFFLRRHAQRGPAPRGAGLLAACHLGPELPRGADHLGSAPRRRRSPLPSGPLPSESESGGEEAAVLGQATARQRLRPPYTFPGVAKSALLELCKGEHDLSSYRPVRGPGQEEPGGSAEA